MTPRGWLLSLILLTVGFAVGMGAGRILGDTADTATSTTTTVMAGDFPPTTGPASVVTTSIPGPTLRELVPELTSSLYLETANPAQLLRWDLDESRPRRVANVPSGHDFAMDNDARFVLVDVPTATGESRLLGGLAGAELSTLSEALVDFPRRGDFEETFWFVDSGGLVALDLRTMDTQRFTVPTPPPFEDVDVLQASEARLDFVDDTGASFSTFYTKGTSAYIALTLVKESGEVLDISLPGRETAYVAGSSAGTILVRSFVDDRFTVDRTSGEVVLAEPDGSCGPVSFSPADGTPGSVCGGVAFVDTPEPVRTIGPWTAGRWSGTGEWFMAVGGAFGEVLLIDAATGTAAVVTFDLLGGARLVDVWSGA